MISANWMTLGFANAKRNVQAPARDPSENSALAAHNFAEPFPYEAPRGAGTGVGSAPPLLKRGGGTVGSAARPPLPCPRALSGAHLGPRGRLSLPPRQSLHLILSTSCLPIVVMVSGLSPGADQEAHPALPVTPNPRFHLPARLLAGSSSFQSFPDFPPLLRSLLLPLRLPDL